MKLLITERFPFHETLEEAYKRTGKKKEAIGNYEESRAVGCKECMYGVDEGASG